MLRIKFPNGIVTADQLRAVGRLSERYGRGMGDITTRQNIQLHWLRIEDMPVILDELNAVGLSFTQACGDVWRNVVGCPLAGVDGHELIDSRPLIEELERTFVGDRALLEPPAQVQGVGVGVPAPLRAARDQRHRARRGREGRRRWATTSGSAAGSGASARMGRRLDVFVLPEEAADVCRAITEIFRDEGKRSKRTRARIKFLVDEWGVERLRDEVEQRLGRVAADIGRPGRSRRSASRPPGRPPAGAAGPLLPGRDHAPGTVHRRPDDRRRRHRRPVRLGRAALHEPPEHHRARRARTARSTRPRRRSATSASRPRPPRSAAASSPAPGWSSASSRSSRRRSGPPS